MLDRRDQLEREMEAVLRSDLETAFEGQSPTVATIRDAVLESVATLVPRTCIEADVRRDPDDPEGISITVQIRADWRRGRP